MMDNNEESPQIQWNIRGLSNAFAYREPTEYIVDKFFARGTLNIVYGAPASMKSMLLADLAACVVTGKEWLIGSLDGGRGIATARHPVFWLDMDNGTRRTDERIEAVARAHNVPVDAPLHYVSMPMPPFNVGDLDSLIYFKTTIRALGAGLVVVDNLGLITGEIEENSAAMAMVMGYLRQIAEDTNTALIVVHHQRKGNGATGGRVGDSLRGHSSIEAAIDLALLVMREPGGDGILVKDTKTRGVPVPHVGGYFNYTHRAGTNDLEKAWFSGQPASRDDNSIQDAIRDIVELEGPLAKGKLVDMVRADLGSNAPGVNKIRAWLDDMLAKEDGIREVQNGKYRLIESVN